MVNLKQLQHAVVEALEDIKARDIQVYDVTGTSALFDRVVIATAESARQLGALASNLRDGVKAAGGSIRHVEGEKTGEWVLVDLGDIVVHIMLPAIRQQYNLEELWGQKRVKIQTFVEKPAQAEIQRKAPGKKLVTKKTTPKKVPVDATAVKKAAAKKPTAVKTATRKAVPKKTAGKKVVAKKVIAKKVVAKKVVAKKIVPKAASTKKPVAKNAVVKKVVAKKTAASKAPLKKVSFKKPAAKKTVAKTVAVKKTAIKKAVRR